MINFDNEWKNCINSLSKIISDKNVIKKLMNLNVSFEPNSNILTIKSSSSILNLVKHYNTEIVDVLKSQTSKNITLQMQAIIEEVVKSKINLSTQKTKIKSKGLASHFRFSNFVVGPSYDEPFLALKNYIKPGYEKYSPLLVFGDNGLGKTHLLHAAGNALDTKGYKVIYLTVIKLSELQNEQIVKKNNTFLIQEKIDNYDVLLIDDIQNFEGKKGVTSIFFDIVDSFIRQRKRILLVADKKPSDLKFFKNRIKSRLLSGLVVRIKELDIITAVNIVKNKKNVLCPSLKLDTSIIQYIAENFSYDVRAIEGALKRIDFFFISHSEQNENITLENVKLALSDLISNKSVSIDMQTIIQLICENFNISQDILTSVSRKQIVVKARHIAMFLIRELCNTSFAQIGKLFGNKDASTVIAANKKIRNILDNKMDGYKKIELLFSTCKDLLKK